MDKFSLKAIKKAMADRNIGTQKELVRLSGLATSTISRVFAGTAKPEAATVTALMKALGITRAQLFGESALPVALPSTPMDLSKDVYLEIKGKVRASPFRFSTSHGTGKFVRGKPGESDCFALEVEGDSMAPIYVPGDIVVCRPHKVVLDPYAGGDEDATFVPYENMAPYHNRDVVVMFNGETNLKRIILERKQGPKYDIYMMSLNAEYPRVKVNFGDEWEMQALVLRGEKPDFIEP